MTTDISALVERLKAYRGASFETTECYNGLRDEAAQALTELAARIGELEANKAEMFLLVSKYAQEAGFEKGRREASELAGVVEGWQDRALSAEQRADRAVTVVKGLMGWGSHDEGCDLDPEYGKSGRRVKCTCGLDAAEKAARAFIEQESRDV